MANRSKTFSSVTILGSKVEIIDEMKEHFSKNKIGYKVPIGSLLVAALEYIKPMYDSGQLKIVSVEGDIQFK